MCANSKIFGRNCNYLQKPFTFTISNPTLQVMGMVPTISIDKTDGCQMFLSENSKGEETIGISLPWYEP